MASRRVRSTAKGKQGDILALCGDGFRTEKADAVAQIDGKIHEYYVEEAGCRSTVHTYVEGGVKHLKTYADATSKDNLDHLPGR